MADIPLSDLALAACIKAQKDLETLAGDMARAEDSGRRLAISNYAAHTRTLLGRLLALVRWSKERQNSLVEPCMADGNRFDEQHKAMREKAADELHFLHEGLSQACVPAYDVRAALDVVGRGAYTQLPLVIAPKPAPSSAATPAEALAWLRRELRLRRAAWKVPPRMGVRDAKGSIVCTVAGEYELAVSAQKPRSAFFIWMDSVGRDAMKEANPSVSGVGELGKLCGDKWLSMGESERAEWEEKAKEEHPPRDGPLKVLRLQPLVTGSAAAWAKAGQRVQKVFDSLPEQPLLAVHPELHAICCERALDALYTQAGALLRSGSPWAGGKLKIERTPPPRAAEAEASAAAAAAGAAAGGSSVAGGGTVVPLPGGVRLSYQWQPGGGDGSRRAAIVVMPDPVTGMRLQHEPPLEEKAGWKWGSAADLNPERLLLDALRERSVRTLTSVAIKSLNSHAALEEGGPLPLLRVTDQASLAISQRDGQYMSLSSGGAHRKLPSAASVPANTSSTMSASVAAGVAAACALRLSAPLAALERTALALGVPARAVPSLEALKDGHGALLWAPLSGTSTVPTEARWLPLLPMPGWGLEVRLQGSAVAATAGSTPFPTIEVNLLALAGTTLRAVYPLTDELTKAAAAEEGTAMAVDDDADGSARVSRLLPLALSLATTRATLETLYDGAERAKLSCERGDGGTLTLSDAAAGGRLCPPLVAEYHKPSDAPHGSISLRAKPNGGGWEASVPSLPQPPGVAASLCALCSGQGTIAFGGEGAATVLSYRPPSAWAVHDLLVDLQGISMAHALLRRLGEQRAAGELDGVRLREASGAGIGVLTRKGRHVRIEWFGGYEGREPPPPQPVLQARVKVDGVPLSSVHRDAMALIVAGNLAELLRQCEREGGGEAEAEAAAAGAAAASGKRKRS